MPQVLHGLTKDGIAVPLRVDEQGRVIVILEEPVVTCQNAPEKATTLVERVMQRIRG